MLEIIVFIYGLIIGSFLNVVILRMDELETIVNTRSHCPQCKKTLGWFDLIPLFSFLILGGKCRYCKKPISWQYPIVELGTALLLVLIFRMVSLQGLDFGWEIAQMAFYTLIVCALVVIFVYDLFNYIIPDEIVWPAIILALVFGLVIVGFTAKEPGVAAQRIILGGLIGAGVPSLAVIPSRGKWMGYGDIKLGALLGLLLGYPFVLVGLFVAFVTGSVVGIGLLLGKQKKWNSAIPFGPFLVVGTLVALLYGQQITDWYLGLFLWTR